MKKLLMSVAFALATMVVWSSPSFADNPVTKGKSIGDKEASEVTGTGPYAQYYGYLGSVYLGYAVVYDNIAQYYNYLGQDGPNGNSTLYYYYAYQYAYYAYVYKYYAYYYSYNKA
jgi:hypothetical protein